ncbi:MAG: peptidoglycan editing factor PgeF [Gammaproteobacteria bacterium]|nr:peptidoglycan editing factor PgeF [Gammaproteobacteria bacterium]
MALLEPQWPVPSTVRAASTLRGGGVSTGCYAGANFGDHVGDEPKAVATNRAALRHQLALAQEPAWLSQVHGTLVVEAVASPMPITADGSWCSKAGQACVVMTADCLPVLLSNRQGRWVAALHAGWRGLCDGIIESGIAAYPGPTTDLLAWLGPCIGPAAFEVGGEVRAAFIAADGRDAQGCFAAHGERYLADLPALARLRLASCGVTAVYGGHWCTHSDAASFYSYRRERVTGRMASLVWLQP